jgi:phosphatidylinositol glycan class T
MYTQTVLVQLPTPDFSMPYNVITLTCTVAALLFGSFFNLVQRGFVFEETEPKGLKAKILGMFSRAGKK